MLLTLNIIGTLFCFINMKIKKFEMDRAFQTFACSNYCRNCSANTAPEVRWKIYVFLPSSLFRYLIPMAFLAESLIPSISVFI